MFLFLFFQGDFVGRRSDGGDGGDTGGHGGGDSGGGDDDSGDMGNADDSDVDPAYNSDQQDSVDSLSSYEPIESYHAPPELAAENSLVTEVRPRDPTLRDDDELRFYVINGATEKGRTKLIDSYGYDYTLKKMNKDGVSCSWRCSRRNKGEECYATVLQNGEVFKLGKNEHNHETQERSPLIALVQAEIKRQAAEHLFKPARAIVEGILLSLLDGTEDIAPPDMVPIHNLARQLNYARKKLRPAEPIDLWFDLDPRFDLDAFYRGDVRIGEGTSMRRHLLFATDQQIRLLCGANRWYIDPTYKVVRNPFKQLMSIHAFVKKGDSICHVPLLFVLMSGKKKNDYRAVFRYLIEEVLSHTLPAVNEILLDFESAIWLAIGMEMHRVTIKGCQFHWSRRVWWHVQGLGMQTDYIQDNGGIRRYIRRLLALPFLPAQEITGMFNHLKLRISELQDDRMDSLTSYIKETWIDNPLWPVEAWSVYGQTVRTNNHTEGWHHRLNVRGEKPNLPFYLLVLLLKGEGRLVSIQAQLVSDEKLYVYCRKKYRQLNGRLFRLWERYRDREVSVAGVLRQAAQMYRPKIVKKKPGREVRAQ